MKVFVTGGTGFIGQNTVKRLVESGHECICLVRGTSNKEPLEGTGCQSVIGDITDKESLIEGMKGCEAVINLANLYSLWDPDMSLFKKINVTGTRNMMEASLKVGIKKVVHVSSIVTWGRSPEAPFNENRTIGEHTSEYARTKYEGDKVDWELYRNKNITLVMIYTCDVLGADDQKSTGNHIRLLIRKKMPIRGLESSAITFVHVNDVAESIVRALEKEDNIGEGYWSLDMGTSGGFQKCLKVIFWVLELLDNTYMFILIIIW